VPSETNNTTDEFSPVLRRYLRERERVDCHGFDIDLATAYLERSLTLRASSEYEGHLADCSPCRLHLLELSQLAELTMAQEPSPEAIPPEIRTGVAPGRSWLNALREALTAPFRMPAFGVVGVALVVAFVTVGLVWQNRSNGNSRGDSAGGPAGEVVARSEVQSETPGATPVGEAADRSKSEPATGLAADPSRKRERNAESAPADATARAASGGDASTLAAAADVEASRRILNLPVAPDAGRQLPNLSSPEPVNSPRSSLQLNVKSGQRSSGSGWIDSTRTFQMPDFGEVNGFASPRQQPRSYADPAEGESAASVRIIRGKTFKLEGRTWVDQEYHQLMRSAGNVTLVFGDQTYERLVADAPILADFFSLRAVTVVWNGKVYRVLAK